MRRQCPPLQQRSPLRRLRKKLTRRCQWWRPRPCPRIRRHLRRRSAPRASPEMRMRRQCPPLRRRSPPRRLRKKLTRRCQWWRRRPCPLRIQRRQPCHPKLPCRWRKLRPPQPPRCKSPMRPLQSPTMQLACRPRRPFRQSQRTRRRLRLWWPIERNLPYARRRWLRQTGPNRPPRRDLTPPVPQRTSAKRPPVIPMGQSLRRHQLRSARREIPAIRRTERIPSLQRLRMGRPRKRA